MPFIVFEVTDPDRLSVVALDGVAVNEVREVCRGESLADVANAIDQVEVEKCIARHRPVPAALVGT